mmetsp:Transcript_27247/g.78387  ORF Transcript_27247/g.78387 Transcript_27247/m.78387 type:complete len:154 (-) Transcript_27247:667-1128(-)
MVVLGAMEAAAEKLFGYARGEELGTAIDESLARKIQIRLVQSVSGMRQMLSRDEWRKEIEWEVKAIEGVSAMIERMCHETALQRGVRRRQLSGAVAQLKNDFVESALAFTDASGLIGLCPCDYVDKPGTICSSTPEAWAATLPGSGHSQRGSR